MTLEKILIPETPLPVGHYLPAIVANGVVYVSGQVPSDPFTGEKKHASIEEQTETCLRNIERILHLAGSDLEHVVKTTAYISDIALWAQVNATYQRVFGAHRAARAIIPVGDYGGGMLIEIDAIALVK